MILSQIMRLKMILMSKNSNNRVVYIKILNTFTSKELVLPHLFNYNQLFCEHDNLLYFIYQYGGKTKKAALTSNPIDVTNELYLKPIGKISKKEWKKMEAYDNK